MYKKFKLKAKYDLIQTLEQVVTNVIANNTSEDDDDKLVVCVLWEIKEKLYQKLGKYQPEYGITFTPTQAFALRILATDYIGDHKSYIGNFLLTMANKIHQQYQ